MLEAKEEAQKDSKTFMKLLDVCAFTGAIWFLLTRIIFGPINKYFAKDVYVADLGSREVKVE